MIKLKIKKGDNVKVITGDDKGKTGNVIKVFPEVRKVLVKGINEKKKHQKPTKEKKRWNYYSWKTNWHIKRCKIIWCKSSEKSWKERRKKKDYKSRKTKNQD